MKEEQNTKDQSMELVLILDRSGSMVGLEDDTIGGYNSLLKKQQRELSKTLVTTVLFDHEYQVLHHREDLRKISPLTKNDYVPRGTTALLDAVGKSILALKKVHGQMKKSVRPQKVLFVITTDGLENASVVFTREKVQGLIQKMQEKHGWTFLFLGANIDAVETARDLGITKDHAADYVADEEGIENTYAAIHEAVCAMRSGDGLSKDWKKAVTENTGRPKKSQGL